jgi:hypothetical protein
LRTGRKRWFVSRHCQVAPIIPDEEVKIAKETNFQNGFPFGYYAYAGPSFKDHISIFHNYLFKNQN